MAMENIVRFPGGAGEGSAMDYAVMLSAKGARVDYEILGTTPEGGAAEKSRLAEMLRALADRIDPA